MIRSIIICDDFYTNPNLVRNLALQAEYENVRRYNYPGFQSLSSYTSEQVIQKISGLVGQSISFKQEIGAFGRFRYMPHGSDTSLRIHLDGIVGWTGVLYLNPEDFCQGGTCFYRHLRTGLRGAPNSNDLLRLGFPSYRHFEDAVVLPDSCNSSAWEIADYVAMRYNRLLLFRGNELFHSHAFGFGTDIENSRLTQNFFFDTQ